MARSKFNPQIQFAIKFFVARKAFEAEAALYRDKATVLGKFLPEVLFYCSAHLNVHLCLLHGLPRS
jgi:hypothetical protein